LASGTDDSNAWQSEWEDENALHRRDHRGSLSRAETSGLVVLGGRVE
jgi:hypothetical protein